MSLTNTLRLPLAIINILFRFLGTIVMFLGVILGCMAMLIAFAVVMAVTAIPFSCCAAPSVLHWFVRHVVSFLRTGAWGNHELHYNRCMDMCGGFLARGMDIAGGSVEFFMDSFLDGADKLLKPIGL